MCRYAEKRYNALHEATGGLFKGKGQSVGEEGEQRAIRASLSTSSSTMNSRASSSDDARTEWLSLEDVYSASVGTRTSDSVAPTIHHCCPTCNGPVACNRTETVSNDSVEGGARERLVQIRSRPSGRYGMFRDLWALRLAAFGSIDRNGGLPFSTATPPGGPDALPMTRTMNDSLIQVVLPFRENKELFGDYVNIYGGIR